MSGLNQSFLTFLVNLSKNNTREWFDKNRKTYETEVKKPFSELVEKLISDIRHYEPELRIKPSEAITRINRDVRFSKDKTPYRTYVGANISVYGKQNVSYPSFALQISPEAVTVYGGIYQMDSATLQKIRQQIAGNPKAFRAAYSDRIFMAKYGEILGEKNARVPLNGAHILRWNR